MHTPRKPLSGLIIAAALLLSACSPRETDLTLFEDITAQSGLGGYEGMTHGAAWGDYDGDGRPDLYVTNHLQPARLFHNLGGGRFADVTAAVLGDQTGGDKHGAAWADFDNDGDQDLVQLTGAIQGMGEEPKRLFVNDGGKLRDQAPSLGVDNPPGRTRMPLWVDLDGDGRLDLFQGAEARHDALTPPFLFAWQGQRFADRTAWLPLRSRSAPFCVLAALNDDRHPQIVCRLMGEGQPNQVFDTATRPARTLDLLPKTAFEDVAVGDFDNDGHMDLFLARKNPGGRVALARAGERILTAQINLTPQNAHKLSAFRFRAPGPVTFTFAGQHQGDLTAADIHLGRKDARPESLSFQVQRENAAGMPKAAPGERPAVLLGSPEPGLWQVEFHVAPQGFGKARYRNLAVRIQADGPIEQVEALEDAAVDETAPQRLFMNRDGKLVEEGDKRGVNARPVAAVNVVAADFDNDMDLDLFVLGSNDAGKTENLLLLNDGKGHFTPVRQAGGAAGLLQGVGDSVTTADVDGDGCLDLLIASGASMGRSLGLPSDNGRYQLFRNLCKNGNHWLMIDLVGTHSNRDGIGARVVVEAGGVKQTRLQGGGIHERGQNHARLHFGLAGHAGADKITVYWPSGKVQTLTGTKADQVLRLKEPD
jgi:hypothetical protein